MRHFLSRMTERMTSVLLWLFVLALSLFRLTTIYHEYLDQFDNGPTIETLTYIALIVISLWTIGRSGQARVNKISDSVSARRENLIADFADGFFSTLF